MITKMQRCWNVVQYSEGPHISKILAVVSPGVPALCAGFGFRYYKEADILSSIQLYSAITVFSLCSADYRNWLSHV